MQRVTDDRRTTIAAYNRPRFTPAKDHVESWFLRANDPDAARALWLKATLLGRRDGSGFAQAWACVFDGDQTLGLCETVELDEAEFDTTSDGDVNLRASGLRMTLGAAGGRSSGQLTGRSVSAQVVSWDLSFSPAQGPMAEPLTVLPGPLRNAGFVRNKLFTPYPVARFAGSLTWAGATLDLTDWIGMQGHNWGSAHSPEYVWGQSLFRDPSTGDITAVVEATSGRLVLGPVTTPLL